MTFLAHLACSCLPSNYNTTYLLKVVGPTAPSEKCYAMFDAPCCAVFETYSTAQTFCMNAGFGNVGRLATFQNCTDYTNVKNMFSATPAASNGGPILIGLTNTSSTAAAWEDPNGICPPEPFSTADWAEAAVMVARIVFQGPM